MPRAAIGGGGVLGSVALEADDAASAGAEREDGRGRQEAQRKDVAENAAQVVGTHWGSVVQAPGPMNAGIFHTFVCRRAPAGAGAAMGSPRIRGATLARRVDHRRHPHTLGKSSSSGAPRQNRGFFPRTNRSVAAIVHGAVAASHTHVTPEPDQRGLP